MNFMLVTERYYKQQVSQLDELRKRLADIRKNKKEAFENCGDGWHDNPFYHHLMHDERMIEKRLFDENKKLTDFQVFDENSVSDSPDVVVPGTTVKVQEYDMKTGSRTEKTLGIVPLGAEDFDNKVFAYTTPRVKPLIGAKVGETITICIPRGTLRVKILNISKFEFSVAKCICKGTVDFNSLKSKENPRGRDN